MDAMRAYAAMQCDATVLTLACPAYPCRPPSVLPIIVVVSSCRRGPSISTPTSNVLQYAVANGPPATQPAACSLLHARAIGSPPIQRLK